MSRLRSTLTRTASLIALTVLVPCWGACEGNDKPAPSTKPIAAKVTKTEAGPVNYDVRRIRPRNEEPLEAMFERLRKQALADNKRVAVLFSADWCEPCRILDAELGGTHPREQIGDVRLLEFKEEDWSAVTRLDEYNKLRERWDTNAGSYPLLVLLRSDGSILEEMKAAKERLEAAGKQATLPVWFVDTRDLH